MVPATAQQDTGTIAGQMPDATPSTVPGAAAWALLMALWITALSLSRIFRKGPEAVERPIRAMRETLLRQAEPRRRELWILLGLFVAVAPLAFIAIRKLEANGKMRASDAASAGMLFGAILPGFGGWFPFDLLRRKLPEKRHLEG